MRSFIIEIVIVLSGESRAAVRGEVSASPLATGTDALKELGSTPVRLAASWAGTFRFQLFRDKSGANGAMNGVHCASVEIRLGSSEHATIPAISS